MIVISVSCVSGALKGDLTKWLMEIDTGVFVGRVSARIREELWTKIENNLGDGRAIMVYNAKNEQGYTFRTLNTERNPVDFEGLTLIMNPLPPDTDGIKQKKIQTKSKSAHKFSGSRSRKKEPVKTVFPEAYVTIDVETSGLDYEKDRIIEIGAIKYRKSNPVDQFQSFIRVEGELSETIVSLTGITQEELTARGRDEKEVLSEIVTFIENLPVVANNVKFDMSFLNNALDRNQMTSLTNSTYDTLHLARKYVKEIENYRLETLIKHFNINVEKRHRALNDCEVTNLLFCNLIKMVE